MFVAGRANTRVTQCAENGVRNTERYEYSVMPNLLSRQHNNLKDGVQTIRNGLRGKTKFLLGYPHVSLGH
eukprot:1876798-Pyramimonas_sp.AAC.1